MSVFRWNLLLVIIVVGVLGCGGSTPPPAKTATPEPVSTPAESPKNTTAEKPVEPAKPVPPKIDENSAAGAVVKTLQALESGNLTEAYDFLPPAYQSDIDGLVHDFASTMDPEVWSRLVTTTRKIVAVLKGKKDLILALDLFRDRPEAEPYRKHWDSSLQFLSGFTDTDTLELSKLKQVSVRSLLPGKGAAGLPQFDAIGAALGANLAQQFAGVDVTPVRTEGPEQIVAIRGPQDQKATEVIYVQHDGRWLPKSLVERWDEGIKADKVWLERFPERIKTIKPQLLDALSQTDEILDQLLAAENREQFERAAGPAILSLALAWPNLQRLVHQATAGNSEVSQVTISINRELNDAELGKFTATVLAPLRESGSDYTLLANDGRTICRLLRVNDVIALNASLATHFKIAAANIVFDRDTGTIKVDLDR